MQIPVFTFFYGYCMTEGTEKFPVVLFRSGQFLRLRSYFLPGILPLQRIPGLSRRMYSEQIPACIEHQKVFHGKAVCKMHHQKGQNIILRRDLRIEDCILQFFKPRKSFQMVILIPGASGKLKVWFTYVSAMASSRCPGGHFSESPFAMVRYTAWAFSGFGDERARHRLS